MNKVRFGIVGIGNQGTYYASLLKDNNVEYDVVTDVKVMRAKGFLSAPRFEVDGKIMDMKETMIWLKETK